MNPEKKHYHGSATKPPRTKGELIHHLEDGHGAVKWTYDPARVTSTGLTEVHRQWHTDWNEEGLEQA